MFPVVSLLLLRSWNRLAVSSIVFLCSVLRENDNEDIFTSLIESIETDPDLPV